MSGPVWQPGERCRWPAPRESCWYERMLAVAQMVNLGSDYKIRHALKSGATKPLESRCRATPPSPSMRRTLWTGHPGWGSRAQCRPLWDMASPQDRGGFTWHMSGVLSWKLSLDSCCPPNIWELSLSIKTKTPFA